MYGETFRATTRHNHKSSDMQSKKISNDQELRPFEKGKYLRNIYFAWINYFGFCSCSVEDFKTSEAQVRPRYLDPHAVFLTHCAISYQDRLENANI